MTNFRDLIRQAQNLNEFVATPLNTATAGSYVYVQHPITGNAIAARVNADYSGGQVRVVLADDGQYYAQVPNPSMQVGPPRIREKIRVRTQPVVEIAQEPGDNFILGDTGIFLLESGGLDQVPLNQPFFEIFLNTSNTEVLFLHLTDSSDDQARIRDVHRLLFNAADAIGKPARIIDIPPGVDDPSQLPSNAVFVLPRTVSNIIADPVTIYDYELSYMRAVLESDYRFLIVIENPFLFISQQSIIDGLGLDYFTNVTRTNVVTSSLNIQSTPGGNPLGQIPEAETIVLRGSAPLSYTGEAPINNDFVILLQDFDHFGGELDGQVIPYPVFIEIENDRIIDPPPAPPLPETG